MTESNSIKGQTQTRGKFSKLLENSFMQKSLNFIKTPIVKEILIFLIIISICLVSLFVLQKFITKLMKNKNDNPWILHGSKNAKESRIITQDPKDENSITLYRSDNKNGMQFTYSFWFVIENMEYKYGEWKHIFHKGNKTSYPNRAPGVFIHKETNTIRVYMNTYKNILEYVDIENIPIKRWVHMAVILDNKYLDIYINGYLRKRHLLQSMAKQNFGDLWLNLYGGFDGYLCRMRYYRRALQFNEVEDIVKEGPSKQACSGSGEKPPYLDDNWWFDI